MKPIFISMYTFDDIYFEAQKRLVESLNQFKIYYKIYEIEDLGNWHLNTNQKAETILKAMQEFPENDIVWVDADAVIKKKPILFSRIKQDIAYHRLEGKDELLSGTLYLKNTYIMQLFVSSWISLNNSNGLLEQKNLDHLLKNNPQISIYHLPASYCKIFDNRFQTNAEDIIVHYQASRILRNKVNDKIIDNEAILIKKKIGNSTIKYKVKL